MPNCKLVMRVDRLAQWNLELPSHVTAESEFSTNKTVTKDVLEACAPNSKFWISNRLLKKFFSFKQWVQYTNDLLKYLGTCCLVIFLVPVMLLVPQSSPGKLVSGAHNLLAFRGSARQAFLVFKFRQQTPPYDSYSIMFPCRCCGLIPSSYRWFNFHSSLF